jgi:hypothetical protein
MILSDGADGLSGSSVFGRDAPLPRNSYGGFPIETPKDRRLPSSVAEIISKRMLPDPVALIHLSGDLTLGDLLVGFGTLALAGFTYRLAAFTRRQVEESGREMATSREGLEVARESIEAADRPYVIPTPMPGDSDIEFRANGELIIRLWNLGRGPAIVSDVQLLLGDREVLTSLPGFIPIHAGGAADHALRVRGPVVDLIDRGELGDHGTLRVFYNSASATTYMTLSAVRRIDRRVVCRHFTRSEPDVDQRPLADLGP